MKFLTEPDLAVLAPFTFAETIQWLPKTNFKKNSTFCNNHFHIVTVLSLIMSIYML